MWLLIVEIGQQTAVLEAQESAMCDVIKIRLKRRIATRIGKLNRPLIIKTAVERPILKLGLPNFRWSFYFILLLVASLLFSRIFMTFQRFDDLKEKKWCFSLNVFIDQRNPLSLL